MLGLAAASPMHGRGEVLPVSINGFELPLPFSLGMVLGALGGVLSCVILR